MQDALRAWGKQAFESLFGDRAGGRLFDGATSDAYIKLHLQISSDDPRVLGWPWEALYDPEVGYLAQTCQIERRLNQIRDVQKLPESLPRDRVNILLVTARPYQGDVQYRSISRPLVELIAKNHLPAHVDVLRPPTISRLRDHLRERPGYYHILHFDGHGAYGQIAGASGPFTYQGPQGALIFEKDDGQADPMNADQLSVLLRECAVPAVVLNACQSAMVDDRAEDQFASVAAALLRSGMRSVVAMAYSLYVSGAQQFLPAFYRRLFEEGSVAQAVRAGRQAMLQERGRVCVRGTFPLDDWLVPVLYQQEPLDFSFAKAAAQANEPAPSKLPPEVLENRDPHGFVGRDGPLLELERAMRRPPPAILIQGMGGVGKTTLARGYLQWLDATNGLGEGSFWFGFQEIRSAEYVFNRMGERLIGGTFAAAPVEHKINALGKAFCENRFVIVWDNFEVAQGIPGTHVTANLSPEDRELLARFLDKLRGGATKVIITSRSPEHWLGSQRRFLLPLGGLEGEERWEYCTAILRDLGKTVNRDDRDLVELMQMLDGHPLAMRAILPRLERLTASEVAKALRNNLARFGPDTDESQKALTATLAFVEQSLPEDLKPLLVPVAMHQGSLHSEVLAQIANGVIELDSRPLVDRLLQILSAAGLLRGKGQAVFELHPALSGFLRANFIRGILPDVRDKWIRGFVNVLTIVANALVARPKNEHRGAFLLYGPSFYSAREEAKRLDMDLPYFILTQALALDAKEIRDFQSARSLLNELAAHSASKHILGGDVASFNQLGAIAADQRDFKTAEKWWHESLLAGTKLGQAYPIADVYLNLGELSFQQRNFEAAKDWCSKSLAITESQIDTWMPVGTYQLLGQIATQERRTAEAQEWYDKALRLCEQTGDDGRRAGIYHDLGMMVAAEGDFKSAEGYFHQSVAINEKLGDFYNLGITYHQLGVVAENQNRFEAADKWYQRSLMIKEKNGDKYGASITYYHLGVTARKQGDLVSAEQWLRKCLVIEEEEGNEHSAALTYCELGIVALGGSHLVDSEQWFSRCLAIKEKENDEPGALTSCYHLGLIACLRGDFPLAEQHFRRLLSISERYDNQSLAPHAHGQLGIIAAKGGQWQEAGQRFIRSVAGFVNSKNEKDARGYAGNFGRVLHLAPPADQAKLKAMWEQAGLGPFPEEQGT
ncbi:MAG TPA: tetratricopeptide repeat protein [Gemmataceae bacterium]|nr:tetratricopeptide repeat protein [Gemmataceae bacterium]